MTKGFLCRNLADVNGHISFIEKDYIEFMDLSWCNKQTDEEFLIETAVKMAIQKIYHRGLFTRYDNADEVLKDYFNPEVNRRCRLDLDPIDNDVIQWFYSKMQF